MYCCGSFPTCTYLRSVGIILHLPPLPHQRTQSSFQEDPGDILWHEWISLVNHKPKAIIFDQRLRFCVQSFYYRHDLLFPPLGTSSPFQARPGRLSNKPTLVIKNIFLALGTTRKPLLMKRKPAPYGFAKKHNFFFLNLLYMWKQ